MTFRGVGMDFFLESSAHIYTCQFRVYLFIYIIICSYKHFQIKNYFNSHLFMQKFHFAWLIFALAFGKMFVNLHTSSKT